MRELVIIFSVSRATEVLVTVALSLLSLGLIYLLILSIRRESERYHRLTSKHINVDIAELKTILNRYINHDKNGFTLLEVTLGSVENIKLVCGDDQYNQAIEEVYARIIRVFQSGARIAKLSDEKLWIAVKNRFKKETLELILDNLIAEIARPIVLVGELFIEFDSNIAAIIYSKELGNLDSVAARLELTSLAAKKCGRGRALIYDRSIENESKEQYALFSEVLGAIKNKDFRIFYQPIISTETLECYAVEAFLRWQHESRGIISPDVFLPLLEHSGDINWVGFWAMEEIAKQLEYWRVNNPETSIKININWSISQLCNPSLIGEIKKILKKYRVSASDFNFEVASYRTAQATEAASKTLATLRQLGFGIAIDNVSLEMDMLLGEGEDKVSMFKFNRDFVSKLALDNEGAKNVAEMVVKTAKKHGTMLVGEGVESLETLTSLKELGIEYAQGYYISKPKAPREAMADILMTPWKS